MTALRTTTTALMFALLATTTALAGPPLATDDAGTVDVVGRGQATRTGGKHGRNEKQAKWSTETRNKRNTHCHFRLAAASPHREVPVAHTFVR